MLRLDGRTNGNWVSAKNIIRDSKEGKDYRGTGSSALGMTMVYVFEAFLVHNSTVKRDCL